MKQAITTILLTLALSGCGYSRAYRMVEEGFDIGSYKYITIYNSESASFIELRLSKAFRERGYEIIGEKECKDKPDNSVLGVRYSVQESYGYYSGMIQRVTILLEDFTTDRTVFTASGKGTYTQVEGAFDATFKELEDELNGIPAKPRRPVIKAIRTN